MSLENRVVVITGATGGLGQVVARHCAGQGARLALLSTNLDKLNTLRQGLSLAPDRALVHALDLSDPQASRAAAQAVLDHFGQIEVLLHCVGGWLGGKPVVEVKIEDATQMLDQHLWTTFHLVQAFVPHLIRHQWGRVIVVSSPSATNPPAHSSPYSFAKAAQEALMLTLAQELKGTQVTANIIQVRTIDAQHERDREKTAKTASWTTPEEIASTIAYLCSDEAHTINGARLPLYGGF